MSTSKRETSGAARRKSSEGGSARSVTTRSAPRARAKGVAAAQASQMPSHERIALEAYLIWDASGRPSGQDLEHWLQAEERLRQGSSAHQLSA